MANEISGFGCRVKPEVEGITRGKDLLEIQCRNQGEIGGGDY
jgi:hypothetical protein